MATQVLRTLFQFKRGLAEAWDRNNPILAAGEPGWTLDTHILKVGDGVKKACEFLNLNKGDNIIITGGFPNTGIKETNFMKIEEIH